MARIKEALLRKLGDEGADTLKRYFDQIQYTAYWCIRMLRSCEKIERVMPEAIEDLVIVRRNYHELHQVKTRNESVGPWTFTEVLPIICQQYHRRLNYPNCQFYFVSNQVADRRDQREYGGSLYRLKLLLEIKHDDQAYDVKEQNQMNNFEDALVPKIQKLMLDKCGEKIDEKTIIKLIHNTHINTECSAIRGPSMVEELDIALDEIFPGHASYTVSQLKSIYENIIFLVVRKIIDTATINERRIYRDDILRCRDTMIPSGLNLDFDILPGRTILDKKMLYGGFHSTELPRFHRQKVLAEHFRRTYSEIGMSREVEELVDDLLECHGECRDAVCRINGMHQNPGPRILEMLKLRLENMVRIKSFPGQDLTKLVCLGLIWSETDNCNAYWHGLEDSA